MNIYRPRLVLAVAFPLVAAFGLWGLAFPEAMRAAAFAATGAILGGLGWLVILLSTGALVVAAWLGFGRHRHSRLGLPGERPVFSRWSWIAMLFAAGMGTGLVVWGVAEPITHFLAPPGGTPLPAGAAARQAMTLTYLHWGFHAWAIYALCGLVIAWFSFRQGRPALVSAPLKGLLPGRGGAVLEVAADSLAIVSITFGLAATLAMGLLTVESGLKVLGVGALPGWAPLAGLALVGSIALASALSGVGRGIRILSDFNIIVALALMTAVLLLGPSATLMEIFVDSVGAYLWQLPELAFRLRPLEGGARWTQDWTLTYFLWWLAWGPFVGVFIARISRGRTVGEFMAGVVVVPALGSMLWFAIMGGSGLLAIIKQGPGGALAEAARNDPTSVTVLLLSSLPMGELLGWVAILLLLVFVVTSVDSAIYVLGMMGAGGAENPPLVARLAWGIALLMLAAAMLSVASVEAARAMAILGALPYPLILLLQSVALFKSLAQQREG